MKRAHMLIAACAPTFFLSAFLAFEAPAPDVAEPPARTTIFAVGDIMLSRDVGSTILRKKDVGYPYLQTKEVIAAADIAFANLETPVTPGAPVPTNSMSFRADPETVTGLAEAGFDVVSLANNHTPNEGEAGLRDTFKYLKAAGIAFSGAGLNEAEAYRPTVIEHDGVRFAFLSYNDADTVPSRYFAGPDRAGTAKMDTKRLVSDIAAARLKADVVLVSMHSGVEYELMPNARQIAFARAAVDAGADAVLGHHSHVIQKAEWYKGKLIFYGLGNFVFDQMWSVATRTGLAAVLTFDGTLLTEVQLRPVLIENYSQPKWLTGKPAEKALNNLHLPFELTDDGARLTMPVAP